jgi:hypothetical protein
MANPEQVGNHAKTGANLTVSLTADGNTIHSFIPLVAYYPLIGQYYKSAISFGGNLPFHPQIFFLKPIKSVSENHQILQNQRLN